MNSTILRKAIRNSLINVLKNGNTQAGTKVFGTRRKVPNVDDLPVIFLFLRKQRTVEQSSDSERFEADIEINLKLASVDDVIDDELDDFVNEVENVLYKSIDLGIENVNAIDFEEIEFEFGENGSKIIGDATIKGVVRYWSLMGTDQGYDEFMQIESSYEDFETNMTINTRGE